MLGLPATGNIALGSVCVNGRIRVPLPAAGIRHLTGMEADTGSRREFQAFCPLSHANNARHRRTLSHLQPLQAFIDILLLLEHEFFNIAPGVIQPGNLFLTHRNTVVDGLYDEGAHQLR